MLCILLLTRMVYINIPSYYVPTNMAYSCCEHGEYIIRDELDSLFSNSITVLRARVYAEFCCFILRFLAMLRWRFAIVYSDEIARFVSR